MVVAARVDVTADTPLDPNNGLLALEERLENGFRLIDRRREAGQEVERWEQRWLRLLREYEELCDEIAAA